MRHGPYHVPHYKWVLNHCMHDDIIFMHYTLSNPNS